MPPSREGAMLENYTRHQQGIIKRYYQNIDQIQLQKLSEMVTELYLAEGKKKGGKWVGPETGLGWVLVSTVLGISFPFSFSNTTQIDLNSNKIWIQTLSTQPNKTYAPA